MTALGNGRKFFKIRQENVEPICNCLAEILTQAKLLEKDCNLMPDQKEKLEKIGSQTFEIARLLGLHDKR